MRAIVNAEELAEVRARAMGLLELLDELELCKAAAHLSMSVDALDRVAAELATAEAPGRVET